jgi:hypothetical protein
MVRVLLALGFFVFTSSTLGAQEKPVEAWWLTVTFTPSETGYESLPVSEINPNWLKLTILNYDSLPPDAQPDLGWMHRDGFHFQIDNYFKRRNLEDRELCGVFEDQLGQKGRFLLVLERIKKGSWKVAFLHQEIGEPGFSVLVRKPSGLFWGTCMLCEEFGHLRQKNGKFYLEEAP